MFSHYKMSHFISAFLLLLIMSLFFTSCRQTAEPQHTPDQSTAAPSEGHLPVSTPIATPMPTDTATAEPEKIRAMPILRIDTRIIGKLLQKKSMSPAMFPQRIAKTQSNFKMPRRRSVFAETLLLQQRKSPIVFVLTKNNLCSE